MATYRVNGRTVTKAEYDQFNFEHFGGPDPNKKKEAPPPPIKRPDTPTTVLAKKPKAKFPEIKGESSLQSMLAAARGQDYARPNRFEVHIFRPPGAHSSGGNITNPAAGSTGLFDNRAMQGISMRCESISMPFRTLSTTEDANIYGPTREIVSGVSYAGNIDLTFQSHGDLTERVFFEEWQKQAFDESSWTLNYYKDYISEVQIFLLNMKDERVYGVVLHEAFPTTINGVDLSQDGDGIIKTGVSMAFRWWEALDETRKVLAVRQGQAFEAAQRTNLTELTPPQKAAAGYG